MSIPSKKDYWNSECHITSTLMTKKNLLLTVVAMLFTIAASALTVNFGANKYAGCAPLWVSFSDSSSGTSGTTTYFWDFGNSITSIDKNPSTTFLTAGTYTVKLTVTSGSTTLTKTKTITVYENPKPQYTVTPAAGCPCLNVTFTNTSIANAPGPYTSEWSFGDGNASTVNNPTYTYCPSGSYTIVLKVKNSMGCTSTKADTSKITVYDKPEVNFSAPRTSFCKSPDTAFFTSIVTKGKSPYTYDWSFGDLPGSSLANPKHGYKRGSYTVRLIVTDANGCKDTMEKKDYIVVDTMNASFSGPTAQCVGVASTFINHSIPAPSKTRWIWSDLSPDGSGTVASHTYLKEGTYTILMIDSFATCADTAKLVFTAHPKPKPRFSFSPIYPCPAPVTINFTNLSSGAVSYLWLFGDGKDSTSTAVSPSHTYTWNKAFPVFLIATSAYGCKDTFRVRDTLKPFPTGYPNPYYDSFNSPVIMRVYDNTRSITVDSVSGCLPMVVKIKGIKTIKIEDVPYGGGVAGPTDKRHDHMYSPAPPFSYPLDPVPDPYPDEYFDPPISTKYPYKFTSYFWDFRDGYTSTDSTPVHTYTVEGRYWIKVTTTTSNGCTFYDSLLIEAGNKPNASFTASPTEICPGEMVTFFNTSVGGAEQFIWDFRDGGILDDTSKTIFHRFKSMDSARVMLTARRFGCEDTTTRLIVITPPKARPTKRYSCDTPMTVFFRDSSFGATSILWDFGDGSPRVSDSNVAHTYAATGNYEVKLIAFNNIHNCVDTGYLPITVFDPKAIFSAIDTTLCVGQMATFEAVTSAFIKQFTWETNGASKSDTNIYNHVYGDTGRYSVRLQIVDRHDCIDSLIRNNYVTVSRPQMNLSIKPLLGCAPLNVVLTDSSTNTKGVALTNRKWDFGDATGSSGSAATVSHTYPPGTYTVKLITTDAFGCSDSTIKTLESRKPKADFLSSVDTFACIGQEINFYDNSTGSGLSYYWEFGDGGTSTASKGTHAYAATGIYTVRLIVTDETGCKDTLSKPAYIKIVKPKASFNVSDSVAICPPLFVTTYNTSSGAIFYTWIQGNGGTSNVPSPVIPYLDSGAYNLILIVQDKHGCTDTASKVMKVLGYDGLLTYTPLEGCNPLKVDFVSDPVNAPVMVWDFADGVTESAIGKTTTSHTYTRPGRYVPRLILGDGLGCVGSSRGVDTIKVDDVVPVVSYMPYPACEGTEITFNDSSYSYFSTYGSSKWTFDDGSTSNLKNPVRTYASAGRYKVILVSTSARGCTATTEREVIVAPLPRIRVRDTVICLNDTAILVPAGGKTYTWMPDPTIGCTSCDNPKVFPLVPTTYYVKGIDSNGCANVDTVEVGIKTKTDLVLAPGAEICAEDSLYLKASGAFYYSWSPGTYLNKTDIADPVAYFDKATTITYTVVGSEGSCIPDTANVTVIVHPLPVVDAGPDMQMLAGNSVVLNGSGTDVKDFLWTPEDSLSCATCPVTNAAPLFTTIYTLKGTSDFGCVDTDQVRVYVFCDQSQLYIPNTFTPNNDGINDVFYPHGKGIDKITSFRVYNRWGQLVFERNSMDVNQKEMGWDGTFKGEQLAPDTFVYVIEATCDNGDKISWKGDVTIIR